jgi:hypothetical protein
MLKHRLIKRALLLGSFAASMSMYGDQSQEAKIPGGYNQNATYLVETRWDVDVSSSYLFWKWQQDSLQLGSIVEQFPNDANGFGNSKAVFQDPKYFSGAKVGLGLKFQGMDDWRFLTEYTWFRSTNFTSTTGNGVNAFVPINAPFFALQNSAFEFPLAGTLSSEVKLLYNSIDFLLERPFYFGKKLTAQFAAGLKTLWVTQHLNKSYSSDTFNLITEDLFDVSFQQKQTSWGLGPKAGIETSWLLGYGIKILANASLSTLYTRYNLYDEDSGTINESSISGVYHQLKSYGTLRPITETYLGLGWGLYFCKNNFHLDLSLGYDFNVYWNYNMAFATTTQKVGNMYLHGMELRGRFDF